MASTDEKQVVSSDASDAKQAPAPASATTDADKAFLNIVDGSGNFISQPDSIVPVLARGHLSDKWAMVAIMGVQSSGKSTLLNLLFGTSFRQMNNRFGRSQTTLGVWIDTANVDDVVVMDLEGTDSGERGEDRTTFERQTTLFALALAEVLIVNMWEHDIGRYTASNYGVLKTVFEVNLQLFKNQAVNKTLILFVVRDHEDETPSDALRDKLFGDIHKIWAEISRPDEFTDAPIERFFDFAFVTLPHMKLQKDKFHAEVKELRDRFADPKHAEFFFSKDYHGAKTVPVDGFGRYAENIWTTIKSSKELNLPTQKEMLATFRCDEVANAVTEEFNEAVKPFADRVNQQLINDFQAAADALINKALQDFDAVAHKYVQSVAQRKRTDLFGKLSDAIERLFVIQMGHAHEAALILFDEALTSGLPEGDVAADNFSTVLNSAAERAQQCLLTHYQNSVIHDVTWPLDPMKAQLAAEVQKKGEAERDRQLGKLRGEAKNEVAAQLQSSLAAVFKNVDAEPWKQVSQLQSDAVQAVTAYVDKKLAENEIRFSIGISGFEATSEITSRMHSDVASMVHAFIVEQARDQASRVDSKLRRRFDKKFRLDEAGLPRRWNTSQRIRPIFLQAREEALKLLDWYSEMRVPAPRSSAGSDSKESKSSTIKLLSEAEKTELIDQFLGQVDGALREAEAEQERFLANTRVPIWAVVLILFLGFDEFMSLLRNPFLLIPTLFLGTFGYAVYVLNMFPAVRFMAGHAWSVAIAFINIQLARYGPQLGLPSSLGGSGAAAPIHSGFTPASSTGSPRRQLSRATTLPAHMEAFTSDADDAAPRSANADFKQANVTPARKSGARPPVTRDASAPVADSASRTEQTEASAGDVGDTAGSTEAPITPANSTTPGRRKGHRAPKDT